MIKEEIVKGSIYGIAAGDALGAPCEFLPPMSIMSTLGTHQTMKASRGWAVGEFTDDTWLTLATARAYENYRTSGLNPTAAGAAMVIWARVLGKGIGGMTACALGNLASGRSTVFESGHKALQSRPNQGAGNGSLMRCASTGLMHSTAEIDIIIKESAILSEITHADPRCVAACVGYNIILAHVMEEKPFDEALKTALAAIKPINEETYIITEDVLNGGKYTFSIDDMKQQGYVLLTYERALIALRDGKNFRDPLVDIVNEGGDADTNGAVAGGLLGAKFGYSAIPSDWVRDLKNKDELDEAVAILMK